ncbi:oligopeptide transport system ATP-binding protein [Spiroplasma chinense]|uniref:Oligopeptide transport system ATP-binding protein n=1 Tax=Spiroplasma chinense TaxID=216932 RepID=A0A5B9Y342_9MOLU|nr:oligopeptide ABC transporter ATP-binding protein OppF [Spiroplasma chinense]QEH61508.1 oligopeptide transport system ATP-binding protein [Spiroplasma chinense]
MNNKEELLNIRDIVVQFRRKGKKNNAVKNVSLDIYKGEVFGLVGESGSGKTTIGRAIVGVQSILDGSIYLEDQLIAGNPTSIYKLNKQIFKSIKEIQVRINAILSLHSELISIIENKLLKDEEPKSSKKISNIIEYFKNKIDLFIHLTSSGLNYLNKIITNFERINRFTTNIGVYIQEVSKELEETIILKNTQTKQTVISIKERFVSGYFSFKEILQILVTWQKETKDKTITKSIPIIEIIKKLKSVSEIFGELNDGYKELIDAEKENLVLSAPLRKRNRALQKYYDLVFIRRKNFFDEATRQLETIKDSNDARELKKYLKDFWTKKNMNLKVCKKIFSYIEKQNASRDKLNSMVGQLKKTLFERQLKDYIVSNRKSDLVKLDNLKKQFKYILNVIKKNVIKDEQAINKYLEWKPDKMLIEGEKKEQVLKFIEYLELPSIDEKVKESFLFRKRTKKEKKMNRKNTQMIFQDPGSSLNDKMSVTEILSEGINNFRFLYNSLQAKQEFVDEYNKRENTSISVKDVKAKDVKKNLILNLMESIGLLPEHLTRYPHEFSGGQKQRIGIARALSLKPKLIVADEPISALDVSIRSQVLNLFKKFKEEYSLTYVFITHDLSVVKYFADRIAVIYQGKIVELASTEELFSNPLHPYTKSLLSAIPIPDPILSKQKTIKVYDAESEHYDYQVDIPYFEEVKKGHFVYANKREIKSMNDA